MNNAIDIYCERLDPAFWAEPVNALSNLGFFLAALLLWRRLRGEPQANDLRVLAALIAVVGGGSFAFHTLAVRWTMWLDQGCIVVFLLAYLHRFLRRVLCAPQWLAALAMPGFVALNVGLAFALAGLPLNGSQAYAGAFVVLLAMTAHAAVQHLPAATALGAAAALFLVSVALRSLDQALCAAWPQGTHFLWHLLNAAVLFCCVEALRLSSKTDAHAQTEQGED